MSRMSILNAPGQQTEGFCMVKSAALRTDSKGGSYMDLVLADAGGECVAKIWNYGPSMGMFEPEDIVKVRGTVTIWKDSEQLKIERIRQATEADQVSLAGAADRGIAGHHADAVQVQREQGRLQAHARRCQGRLAAPVARADHHAVEALPQEGLDCQSVCHMRILLCIAV